MATSHGYRSTQSQLVLLLLGERGSGKSSAGNAILSRKAFHKKTTRSCRKNNTVFGLQVAVVDTPGWPSLSTTPSRVSKELGSSVTLCHPGPDAILLVLPAFSVFGPDQWSAMEAQLRLLETPVWQRAVVLFTHGDRLGALSIQHHIQQQGETLQWLLRRCGNRYQLISSQSSTVQLDVRELFGKIQKMAEVSEKIRDICSRLHIQFEDLSIGEQHRRNQRPREIEMGVMGDTYGGDPGEGQQLGLLWLRGLAAGRYGLKPAVSFILLGRRKSGKSCAGNMILGREEFQRDKKTVRCASGHAEISGWSVTVVDTPGWSLFGQANTKQVKKDILLSPSFCPAGSKVVVLLAVPVDSFAEKDREAAETYVGLLGCNVWGSSAVLFTYGDALKGKTIESYIKKKGRCLQWVLDMCGQRHLIWDTYRIEPTQVEQLLEMAENS